MLRHQEIEKIYFDDMVIPDGRRAINQSAVDAIAESIKQIGLLTPITVRILGEGEQVELVTGAHRVAAAKKLGWDGIESIIRDCDEIEARLWEIAENLHRSDLTALERDEQIAEWIRLCKERKVAQLAPPLGGPQPNEGGKRAAAKELGINRRGIDRAAAVDSLSDEAKQAAREAGLDNNRSALLEAARYETPSAQVHYLQNRTTTIGFDAQIAALMNAWKHAGSEARQEFLKRIEQPPITANG